jgi:hypothetical protein
MLRKNYLMLPAGFAPTQLLLKGTPITFTISKVEGSAYLEAMLPGLGQLKIK